MAYWDSKNGQIVYFADRGSPEYPGWVESDCGCCAGLEWGGEQPRECGLCGGSGIIWKHIKSGALAAWPGGPFIGKEEAVADQAVA